MVPHRLPSSALQRDAGSDTDRALPGRRCAGVAPARGPGSHPPPLLSPAGPGPADRIAVPAGTQRVGHDGEVGPRRRFRAAARTAADGSRASACRGPIRSPSCSRLASRTSKEAPLALGLLHDAAARFDRADMKLYAAVTKRRIGALQRRDGRALKREAEEWMAAQNIRNPVAMTRTLAPGFPDVP